MEYDCCSPYAVALVSARQGWLGEGIFLGLVKDFVDVLDIMPSNVGEIFDASPIVSVDVDYDCDTVGPTYSYKKFVGVPAYHRLNTSLIESLLCFGTDVLVSANSIDSLNREWTDMDDYLYSSDEPQWAPWAYDDSIGIPALDYRDDDIESYRGPDGVLGNDFDMIDYGQ